MPAAHAVSGLTPHLPRHDGVTRKGPLEPGAEGRRDAALRGDHRPLHRQSMGFECSALIRTGGPCRFGRVEQGGSPVEGSAAGARWRALGLPCQGGPKRSGPLAPGHSWVHNCYRPWHPRDSDKSPHLKTSVRAHAAAARWMQRSAHGVFLAGVVGVPAGEECCLPLPPPPRHGLASCRPALLPGPGLLHLIASGLPDGRPDRPRSPRHPASLARRAAPRSEPGPPAPVLR